MNIQTLLVGGWPKRLSMAALGVFLPMAACAQGGLSPEAGDNALTILLIIIGLVGLSVILTRMWTGVANVTLIEAEPLASIEKRHPYLPSVRMIGTTIIITGLLCVLSIKAFGGIAPFGGENGWYKALVFFTATGALSMFAQMHWPDSKKYSFAFIMGTVLTFLLLGFKRSLFDDAVTQNPFTMAIGIVCVVMAWRFLFGPWRPDVKATVLGTFIFWVGMHIFWKEAPEDRTAHMLATIIALIPAFVWCMLFLKYQRQRKSLVLLMFFAGMLSTAPILFYDAMVRNGVELQFFLFRIVPENFNRSSSAFVSGNIVPTIGLHTTLLTSLISFMIVGLIEELSKFWVLRKSGQQFFASIDDVMQLAIIVAIGFAFAENVLNPSYFVGFVKEFLIAPVYPDWSGFIGNVLGRAILTNMVHIVSTGVFGYFYGLYLFAGPYMEDAKTAGHEPFVPHLLHDILRLPEKVIFRREMMMLGLVLSIVIHGLFNFLVTLPDMLPGHPVTLGDLFGAPQGSFLHFIAILLVPSLLYVVGGFWLLSTLFYRKQSMKKRGHIVTTDTFVTV